MSAKKQDSNGQNASLNSKRGFRKAPSFDLVKVRERLAKVFDEYGEGKGKKHARLRWEFVFHMTDWASDLEKLYQLYLHPEQADLEETLIFLLGAVSHVSGHLNAANRILWDRIADPFNPSTFRPLKAKAVKKRRGATLAGN